MLTYHNTGKCSNPLELTHINVMVWGYEEPSLEGNSVTFACPAGLVPTGSYSSTCMRNGEWEPDPREVTCTRRTGDNCHHHNIVYVQRC